MKYTIKLIIFSLLSVFCLYGNTHAVTTQNQQQGFTTLRSIDLETFNEFRYLLTEQFFQLRDVFEVTKKLDRDVLQQIALIANEGYKYLPDNLQNQDILRQLLIDIQKWVNTPENEILYPQVVDSIAKYIDTVEIQWISGTITATPESGNAPLTVTFRSNIVDPSGSQIRPADYTWWADSAGTPRVIGRGPSTNFTFREEGRYSIFLDVTSSHKNQWGLTDVLPYRGRIDVVVQEKVATMLIKVNGESVSDNEILKFTPDVANYWLLFDATSSIPTGDAKFVRTEWDFGNGGTRLIAWPPRVERVRFTTEWDYNIGLRLTTNEGKVIQRVFSLIVRDPIARIDSNKEDGFVGENFTFSAKSSGLARDLSYSWEIVDIENDTILVQKSDKVLTHSFDEKWKYNIRLKVRQSSGEIDQDNFIVYITSRAPIAQFSATKKQAHIPQRILLDASRSSDPDTQDDGRLKYDWFIDGKRIKLLEANANNSLWYYEFDSIGNRSITLEVTDPDGITSTQKKDIQIDSLLSVDFDASPRVIQRNNFIKFTARSPNAEIYEWDFGDGKASGGNFSTITHTYERSGKFDVTLKVSDKDNNTNTFKHTVYVSESNKPLAFMDVGQWGIQQPVFDKKACNGKWAYIVDRINNINLKADRSINIDGTNQDLEYSWKIGQAKFVQGRSTTHKFDEIGCFPLKLTVKSSDNGATDVEETLVEVRNLLPTLSSLSVDVEDPEADPLIIRVTANGAKDLDGVVQSYLWYYYTDIDAEPQDFRSTSTSSTAFVIPKITGNYYFVVILKDNNEARAVSEEITGSRFFTTITGDNINTPIIELSVDDNSTVIWEEVTFEVGAKNILGQSIEKDASYSWDFDGDGFYDTQTTEPTVSYKYNKSGEFFAKVKVKYRGISSTKNITMNVGNKLVPDFGYISVGNKYIFFDSSTWQVDNRSWELWDGTKKTGTNFVHSYDDKKTAHEVTLKISEGTKSKEVTKTVRKNVKNILKTRNKWFVALTFPELDQDDTITLDAPGQKFFVYLWESGDEVDVYGIDYDTSHDSDLNGGTDDDSDNIGTSSYSLGDIIEIPLNQFASQTIRLYTQDANKSILGFQDITVNKTYIEETQIDPNTIIFEGVSDSEREKIERLKSILTALPQDQKLQSLSFVQKLQENWNDNTEKTRTILDFENYIFELGLSQEDEIIEILESLLVEWQEDQSAKQITYTALVNLIPQGITCETSGVNCYEDLLSKLEDIRSSDDVEYNRVIWKEILEAVGTTDLMSNQQKLDFRAILKSLVYGGDIESIPEEEKQEVIAAEPPQESSWEWSGILGILLNILKWIAYFFILFLVLVWIFYIFYLIFNKDKSIGFSQFVSRVTSWGKKSVAANDIDNSEDILAELSSTPEKVTSDVLSDITSSAPDIVAKEKDDITIENLQENRASTDNGEKGEEDISLSSSDDSDVPEWLKGNFNSNEATSKTEEKEWISKTPKKEIPAEAPVKEEFNIDTNTTVGEENVPDWLKGVDLWSDKKDVLDKAPSKGEEKIETPNKEAIVTAPEREEASMSLKQKLPTEIQTEKFDLDTETKIDESNVPDWLKGSFDTKTEEKIEISDDSELQVEKDTTIPQEKSEKQSNPRAIKSSQNIKGNTKKISNTESWKKKQNKKIDEEWIVKGEKNEKKSEDSKKSSKKIDNKKEPTKKDLLKKNNTNTTDKITDNLWDDGMKIPDWLKWDND